MGIAGILVAMDATGALGRRLLRSLMKEICILQLGGHRERVGVGRLTARWMARCLSADQRPNAGEG
jgi:hypothetical protein